MFKKIIYAKIGQIFRPCKIFIPLSCYYKALLYHGNRKIPIYIYPIHPADGTRMVAQK